jgi:ribA/ribD-fused uncharacterized protein
VTKKCVYIWNPTQSSGQLSLSNISISPFDLDGIYFTSSQQAFMYMKAIHFQDGDCAKSIHECQDSTLQHDLCKSIRNVDHDEWDNICRDVMYRVCMSKFQQNSTCKELLLSTINRTLVVLSIPHRDDIWSINMTSHEIISHIHTGEDRQRWRGENRLGHILEKVRATFQNEKVSNSLIADSSK